MLLEFRSIKTKNEIIHFLTGVNTFVDAHPLIYKMELLNNGTYKVFEEIKAGPIPIRFTYFASISSNKDEVHIAATVMRFTKIKMDFSFVENIGGCLIKEEITIDSPLPIHSFMNKLFEKQHALLFSNMEKQI